MRFVLTEIPDRITKAISNIATVGGLYLGFYSLAAAIRDHLNIVGALIGLLVGVASAISLLSGAANIMGSASYARAISVVSLALLTLIVGFMAGLFAFMEKPLF